MYFSGKVFFCFVLRWRSSPAVLKNCAIPIRSPQRWSIIFNNALFLFVFGKAGDTKVMSNGLLVWALTILDDRRSLFYFWNCWIRGRLCFYFSVISISKCVVVFFLLLFLSLLGIERGECKSEREKTIAFGWAGKRDRARMTLELTTHR